MANWYHYGGSLSLTFNDRFQCVRSTPLYFQFYQVLLKVVSWNLSCFWFTSMTYSYPFITPMHYPLLMVQNCLNSFLILLIPLRGHATNSYGFTTKILFSNANIVIFHSLLYQMCFMVLENHHLQLEILTLRLTVAFLAKSLVNPHVLDLVVQHFFNFVIWHLNWLVRNKSMEVKCLIKQDTELFKISMKNINLLFWSHSSHFQKSVPILLKITLLQAAARIFEEFTIRWRRRINFSVKITVFCKVLQHADGFHSESH